MRFGILALSCMAMHVLSATSAGADAITLRTGDVLHGRLVETVDGLVLDHEVLGRLRLERADVASVQQSQPLTTVSLPASPAEPAPAAGPLPMRKPTLGVTTQRLYGAASDKGPWTHTAGISLNTASGNSDVFNLEADAKSRYECGNLAFELGGHMLHTRTDGETIAQHYHANARVERKLDSRTYVFGQVLFDRDELADLEYRVNGTVGVGRVLAKTNVAELRGEIGAGLTHEKRVGMPTTTDPSGWLALDYERSWTDGSKFTAALDFLPNFGNFDLSVTTFDAEYARSISELMSLVFGLRMEYVIDPPAAKSLDTYFRAGVRLDW